MKYFSIIVRSVFFVNSKIPNNTYFYIDIIVQFDIYG